jgi:hypothetical protein
VVEVDWVQSGNIVSGKIELLVNGFNVIPLSVEVERVMSMLLQVGVAEFTGSD